MLTDTLKQQLTQYLALLVKPVVFTLDAGAGQNGEQTHAFLTEVSALSDKLTVQTGQLNRQPSFTVDLADGEPSGITFAGIPLGHEFESFVLAVLQVSGHAPKIPADLRQRIEAIDEPLHFETFASLSCHNCPDVVQALNMMSVLNPKITHTMIEGGMYQTEAESRNIMAVPTVFLNGQEWHSGRATLTELVNLAVGQPAVAQVSVATQEQLYDVLIIGGGPAASAAAVYAARKGLATAVVADHFGGQPLETVGIENLIGTDYVEGEQLMQRIQAQLVKYHVTLIDGQTVTALQPGRPVTVTLTGHDQLRAKMVIIATGARWRQVGVPGETAFQNRGVAYCPHCDGPLYRDKAVAVIGGGNSGVEAAIDLAGIAKHVTVLEFGTTLSADAVLQQKLETLANVNVATSAKTTAITGDGRVTGLRYLNQANQTNHQIDVDGVFVQIGLTPNTNWLGDTVARNQHGEIIVDRSGATNVPNVFAAGDCTDSAYKQIVIAMGAGATAALGAFDALVRQTVD